MTHSHTMNDLLLALSITVFSSTAGLAVAAVLPPVSWWQDPRLFAPLLSAGVNALWFAFRVWRRRQHKHHLSDERQAQWARQEAQYVLRIQKLEQAHAEQVALIRILRRQGEDLRAELLRPQAEAD